MEYRHGPISIAEPGRVVWVFGEPVPGLLDDVERTGATIVNDDLDPVADLVRVQQLAVRLAERQRLRPGPAAPPDPVGRARRLRGRAMILCVAASPALDVTYQVERLAVGATNRVRDGGAAAGRQGHQRRAAAAPAGRGRPPAHHGRRRHRNRRWSPGLTGLGIPHDVVPTAGETRRTVAVVDEATGDVTMLNEPARVDDWPGFVARAAELIARADVVVISGSLPGGAPVDGFAELVRPAREHGRPVVLDTSGPALVAALEAGPTLVKPNADELRDCTDETTRVPRPARSRGGGGSPSWRRSGPTACVAVDGRRRGAPGRGEP